MFSAWCFLLGCCWEGGCDMERMYAAAATQYCTVSLCQRPTPPPRLVYRLWGSGLTCIVVCCVLPYSWLRNLFPCMQALQHAAGGRRVGKCCLRVVGLILRPTIVGAECRRSTGCPAALGYRGKATCLLHEGGTACLCHAMTSGWELFCC